MGRWCVPRGSATERLASIWEKYAAWCSEWSGEFFGPAPITRMSARSILARLQRLNELREPAALPGFIIGITLGVARNEARRRRIRAIVA